MPRLMSLKQRFNIRLNHALDAVDAGEVVEFGQHQSVVPPGVSQRLQCDIRFDTVVYSCLLASISCGLPIDANRSPELVKPECSMPNGVHLLASIGPAGAFS